MGGGCWPRQVRLSTPRIPVPGPPKSQLRGAGGGGQRCGGDRARGKGLRGARGGLTSWLLGGGAAHPRAGCSWGSPACDSGVRGWLGAAQSFPGSRPIEPGFLGGRWTGQGRALGRLHSWEGSDPGSPRREGVRRASPARPLGRRRLRCYSYYCTSLCYISFQNSTPRTHNAPRLKGAVSTSRRQGVGWGAVSEA